MPQTHFSQAILAAFDQGYCLCEMLYDAQGRPADYRFIEVNPCFEEMTGLRGACGRTALEMMPRLEPIWIETCARAAAGERIRLQSRVEELGRWFDVFATPIPAPRRFAVVFRDTTAQHDAEAEREAARVQAERLLHELNHRVMNSLAMITAIVRMEGQALEADGPASLTVGRLQARLAAVTTLYRALNNAASSTEVPSGPYLESVAAGVAEAVAEAQSVRVICDIAPVMLPTEQAAPLGLLVNELMTNAVKHAFPAGRSGTLRVSLTAAGRDMLRLAVADDGIGATPEAEGAPLGTGMGAGLIEGFAAQLGGVVTRRSDGSGTEVAIGFPRSPPSAAQAADPGLNGRFPSPLPASRSAG